MSCVVQYLNLKKVVLELETFREGQLGWIVLWKCFHRRNNSVHLEKGKPRRALTEVSEM